MIYEGAADDTGIAERFTFEEHINLIKKMRPEALTGNAESVGEQNGEVDAGQQAVNGAGDAPKRATEDTEMEGS